MDCRDAKVGIVPLTQPSDGRALQKTKPTGQFSGRIVAMTRALAAARVVNTIRRILMQDSSLAFLKNEGVLYAEFLFKNAVIESILPTPKIVAIVPLYCRENREIPFDLAPLIQKVIENILRPSYVTMHPVVLHDREILGRVAMQVSDCRYLLHMNQEGIISNQTPLEIVHTHAIGINAYQDKFHQAETEYQRLPITSKVELIARRIFGPNSKYRCIMQEIKAKEGFGKVWLNLNFNSKDTLSVDNGDKSIVVKVMGINLGEIIALFKLIQAHYLGKRPICQYVQSDEENLAILGDSGQGEKSDILRMTARYQLN